MNKVYLAAQTWICTVLFLSLAHLASGQGLHYTPQELAVWRQRAVSGPYKTAGDAGTNTPADWSRIQQFADDFRASPLDTGNTSAEALDIWTGYRYQYDSLGQYPIWQGIKMAAAGFKYLLSGDTSYGQAVRRTLLAQVRFTHPVNIGYNVATWPVPSNGNVNPTNESGAKECVWLSRLLFSYDYTKDLFSPAEQDEIETYFRNSAWYFANRIHGVLVQNFPNRLQNNYTTKVYAAAPGGVIYWNPPVYAPAQYPRHQVWGDGYVYTHRNEDGSLGNKIPRIAYYYNNRVFEKMHFIGLCGLETGDTLLTWHAKQAAREFIRYSVFPDGTYGEYERNGDYGNPNQGAFQYGCINLQSIVMLADALARKGDFSIYQFSTTDGVHGTQVPAGGQPKSLLTVLTRMASNALGSPGQYWGNVAPLNRIDINNENTNTTYTINHVTWDYLLASANKYYQSSYLKNVYLRRANGAVPYPTTNLTSAGKVWVPWSGTGAEYPGYLFMFGQMETTNAYDAPCLAPTGLAAGSITTTGAQLSWTASTAASAGYRVEYKPTSGSNWTARQTSTATMSLSGLTPATAYQVRIKSLCSSTDSSAVSAIVSFTTATPPCPVPTGVTATSTTPTSLTVNATGGTGVLQYKVEYRLQGGITWLAQTVNSLPLTLNNLQALTTYEVRVTAICATNQSAATTLVTGTTLALPCPMPTGLALNVLSASQIRVNANAATGAVQYKVEYRMAGNSSWTSTTVNTLPTTLGGLQAATAYEVRVTAICPTNQSTATATATATTQSLPCPMPTGLVLTPLSSSQISVNADPAAGAVQYKIEYRLVGGSSWTVSTVNALPATLQPLNPNTPYEVRLTTLCATNQSAATASATATTQADVCSQASNLRGTPYGYTDSAKLEWSAASGAAQYQIRLRKQGNSNWKFVVVSTPYHTEALLQAGATYEYQVNTICGSGISGYTASKTFAMPTPPCPVVTGVAVNAITQTSASVSFTGQGSRYEVRYRLVGNSAWLLDTVPASPAALSGLAVRSNYEVQVRTLCATNASAYTASANFSTLAPPCPAATSVVAQATSPTQASISFSNAALAEISYRLQGSGSWTVAAASAASPATITGLLDNRAYDVRVTALCGTDRAPDAFGSFSTPAAVVPCDSVTAVTVSGIQYFQATVAWQAVAGNARGYNVRFRAVGGTNWLTTTINTPQYTMTALEPGTRMEVQVQNLCTGTAESAWTQSRYFYTVALPCGTPTVITGTLVSTDSVRATWASVARSTSYRIRITNLTTPGFRDYSARALQTSLTIGGLTPGYRYRLSMQSFCTGGESGWIYSDTLTMPLPCSASGIVRRETWSGVPSWSPGAGVPARPANAVAELRDLRDSLRTTPGTLHRVRGFLCIPATGAYTFALAGGTRAELRMSTTMNDTGSLVRMVGLSARTPLNQYGPGQQSQAVSLMQGARYFVEILYYGADSTATFSLGWSMPGTGSITAVPADRFTSTAPAAGTTTALPEPARIAWTLAPNPAGNEGTRLYGPEGSVRVLILDATGKVVAEADRFIPQASAADLTDMLPQSPGIYTVVARGTAGLYRTRLVRE